MDDDRLADARTERLSERVRAWCEQGALRGAVVGLARRDGPVWLRAWGQADTATGDEPMRPDHRFLLTSITKTLTATQVLQLVERGDVTLDTPVSDLVPEFSANGKDGVRLWHLLTHTSGLDDREANTAEGPPRGLGPSRGYAPGAPGPGEHLAAACAAPLRCPPGTEVAYCSPPFWVLAELIRRCTGRSHADHLRANLIEPLEMRDTRYEPDPDLPERYVLAHVSQEHAHLAEQVRHIAYPAGGLVGTAADLIAYGRMILRNGRAADGTPVLSRATIAAMARPWTVGLPGERAYEGVTSGVERGLGWAVGGPGDLRSDRTLWHSGGSGTSLWIDPEHDLIVVLLTATWFLPYDLLARVSNLATAAAT